MVEATKAFLGPTPFDGKAALIYCAALLLLAPVLLTSRSVGAEDDEHWTDGQKPLAEQLRTLRDVDDRARPAAMLDLAQKIQRLPASANKLRLGLELASKSTEGDFGRPTIQATATCLATALREKPIPWTAPSESGDEKYREALLPAYGYSELAQLEHYEHVAVSLSGDPHYQAAKAALDAADARRTHLDFALQDRTGKTWKLSGLRGKVVLVNFWATWCPPCRKEIPDLDALYQRFADKGLIVLGISDEAAPKIDDFLTKHSIAYPVLLDSDRAVNKSFAIQGIPKSFVYDRSGQLVAQAIDMRTQKQFLEMLRSAGIGIAESTQ
jgi:peroxiredoxin